MSIAEFIIYISALFWLFPPIRQFNGEYFYYFLILAISDPANLICIKLFGLRPNIVLPVAGILLLISITASRENLKISLYRVIVIVLAFIIFFICLENHLFLLLIIHIFILLTFISISTRSIYKRNEINLFLWALSFYELSIVINLSEFVSGSELRIIIYYMTLSFQFLIAIFFTIFTEKSNSLIIRLKSID